MKVGGDLRVVRGNERECLGGKLLAQLSRNDAQLLQLANQARVVHRTGHRRDPARVSRGGAEERHTADVDHLERFLRRQVAGPDGRRERFHVDDDDVDESDALVDQFGELGRVVAAGENAGVDRGVECLDLAPDERRHLRQLGDAADLDAVSREVLARAVGCVDLRVEREQIPGECRDAVAVGDREEGSHRGNSFRPEVAGRTGGCV